MDDENVSGEHVEAAAPVESEGSAPLAEATENAHASIEKQVPLDALQAERAERQKLQDEVRMLKEYMQISNAQRQPEKPQDEFTGLSDDDVLTVGEFKKAIQSKEKQYQMNMQEIRMTQKYPDYADTVTKYLPEVIKQNPSLADSLQKTHDYELAYYLAKNSDAYKAENKRVKKNADAERIVQNAARSGSLSSVGQTSPINKAKQYKNMSDTEFQKEVNRNMGYF